MRINRILSVVCAATVFYGMTYAGDLRSPLIGERGPMRYVFEEQEEGDYGVKVWATGYGREAHKCFMGHGFNTKPLTALYFNKSDFRLSEIFADSYLPLTSEFYNPYVGVLKLHPRASYSEKGISIGARWSFPVYKDVGRAGFRVSVPFRNIEIEREDSGDKDSNQLKDLYTSDIVNVDDGSGNVLHNITAQALRLDFLESLYYTAKRESLINYNGDPNVDVAGNPATSTTEIANLGSDRSGAIIYSPEGFVPKQPTSKLGIHQNKPVTKALPVNGNVSDNEYYGYEINGGNLYYKGVSLNNATSVDERLIAQDRAAQLWYTSAHKNDTAGLGSLTSKSNDVFGELLQTTYLASFQDNTYAWLEDRGYELETKTRAGIGDLDLDFFYEHELDTDLLAEVMLGFKLPTGSDDNFYSNPYAPHLGNGGHFEIKFGAMVAWQPLDWFNIKLDTRIGHAFGSTEKRSASFKGAQIKNIGPRADADVSWTYFVGTFDGNFFHPQTDAISGLIGYELYYKGKDNVSFKDSQITSWLGRNYDVNTSSWLDNKQTLDDTVTSKNTDAIGHKIRLEASFRISKWFEIFAGATYTFAGQHIPREGDCQAGFVATF